MSRRPVIIDDLTTALWVVGNVAAMALLGVSISEDVTGHDPAVSVPDTSLSQPEPPTA